MSSLSENGNGMVMPVAPTGNGGFGGFGNDGAWWIILLVILFGGWGNGYGGNNGGGSQLAYGIGDIQTSICNGFSQAETAANARQIADMQQMFALQQQFSQCCCDNRIATADLKYTISQENCSDRQAVNDALVTLSNQLNAGIQSIKDEFCNDRLARKDEIIADLRQQINERDRLASQNAQTATLVANNEAQTTALEQYLAPVARPAYIVPNPNCCQQNYGYGCCGAMA